MSKYIKKFETISAATGAQDLVSPNVSYIKEGEGERILYADLGDNESLRIEGEDLEHIVIKKNEITISGEWTSAQGTNNKTKVKISGEVTLTSKVDCYSIEFLSGGHLTINGGARLRIWEGGIVNNDCETVNYLTLIEDAVNNSWAEYLIHPSVNTHRNILGSIIRHSTGSMLNSSTYKYDNFVNNFTRLDAFTYVLLPEHCIAGNTPWSNAQVFDWEQKKWVGKTRAEIIASQQIIQPIMVTSPADSTKGHITYTLTGLLNNSTITIKGYKKYYYMGNPFCATMSLQKLIQYFNSISITVRDVQKWDFSTQTYIDCINEDKMHTTIGFIPYLGDGDTDFTLNYKDLVWDPSFEEEVQAPLLTTMSAPMMTTSSPSSETNDGLQMPPMPSIPDGEGMIFED